MSEVAPNTAPTAVPPDEPTAETPSEAHAVAHGEGHEPPHEVPADAVPEAEASVEQVTEPDPEHAPEPEPTPPPELAEVAADNESMAVETTAEALVPVTEPESEAMVPVHEPTPEAATHTTEAVTEEVPSAEPETEEEQKAKPAKRTRTPKAPKTPAAVADVPSDPTAPTETVTPSEVVPGSGAEAEPKPENKKKWYAIKVQSGREDTIKAAILRKVAIEGLEDSFGQIVIPYEEEVVKKTVRVKDKKTGEYTTQEKKVTRKKKKFQGYLFAELEFNDRILYLFRETSGVGDFLNLRGTPPVPEPMPEHEVQSMLTGEHHVDPMKKGGAKKVKLEFEKGDRIRVREGSFANQEGEVKAITEPKDPTDTPKITVVLTFWGRPLEVELDYWQVEKV